MTKQYEKTSKFLSYILRHQPQAIGLTLNSEGWADIDMLIACAAKHNTHLSRQLISEVVITNDKKRFTVSEDGQRIRAAQGHSTEQVAIDYQPQTPPEFLYHGTATRFMESIREKGLIAGSRHHVHLSSDKQTAMTVGKRHGKVVVLRIKAQLMQQQGFKFYLSDNNVWLTEFVPMAFIME